MRKRKTEREYERQFGGFVPTGIVRGQSKRRRPEPLPAEPSAPETEPEPTPAPETEPTGKDKK
jgi:hypothetical protein